MKRLLASFVLALSIFTLPAHGEDFPSRPIKILVPAAPEVSAIFSQIGRAHV